MLLSKFYLPELRPNRVDRPHLLERLRQAANCQLVIISAPAGFGKTTLASEWVRSAQFKTSWISLEESDNDPVRFWTGVVTAIDQLFPGASKISLSILAARQPVPPQVLLKSLLNELILQNDSQVGDQPACLVLDDTHLVSNAAIYEGLVYLIEHLPHHLRLALIGRSDPPIPLGRLRANCRVLEIRAADLRFSPAESQDFLNRVMGFSLSQEHVKRLEERTEGWVAGLQLAGLAMQGWINGQEPGDIDTFIENFSGDDRYILDYLMEEVIDRLPSDMRSFLLQTSILGRMSGSLCDAVTGISEGESQVMLERFERENLFLIPLDNRRQWYRYHHLFADLLRNQLQRLEEGKAKKTADDLHRRAACWLVRHDCIPEAIGHALQGQDFEHAAQWVEAYAQYEFDRGEYATLKNWIDQLPQTVLYSRPELLMQYAWTINYLGEMTLYQQPLSVAEQLWRKQGNLVRLGEALNLRADFAGLAGDSASVAELAQQALDLLPEEEEYQRGMSWMYAGIAAFLQGDLEEANKAFQTASALCKRSGNTAGLRLVTLDLAQVQRAQGKLPEAARLLNEIISQPDSLLVFEGQVARVLMSMIWREWNRLDEAEEVLQNVLEMVEPMKQLNHFFQCYPTLAIIRWEKGDVAGMQAALDQQAHLAEQMQDSVGWKRGLALRALLAVLSGDLAMAQIWRISNHPPAEDLISLQNEIMYLVQARLQVRLGGDEARQALAMLEQLQEAARKQQRSGSLIEIKMIQALGLSRLNDTTGAITALEESLSLALPGGYRRIYLDEGQPLIDLLNLLVRKPSLPPELRDYATQLLALVPDPQLSAWNEHATAANLKLIEPLTPREIEVLRLIRDGLSNREIAEKLYLTLNTVKVHAKNIFAKLDVESRTQAVHRAGELGLI